MAVHQALDDKAQTNELIAKVSNICVLNTETLQKKAVLKLLYRDLERMQAKVTLLDQVIEDIYVPITDEILETLASAQKELVTLF